MGGVQTGRDALELIACGATHVALGTVLFADPEAPAAGAPRARRLSRSSAGFDNADDAFSAAQEAVFAPGN